MIVGRITKVDGVRAAATFFDRMQPFIVNNGQAVASPRINSFVKTGVGLDTVICQIVGEHEAEYDRRSEVTREVQAAPMGPFVVDLEVRGHVSSGDFKGGLRCLPIVGAAVESLDSEDLKLLYSSHGSKPLRIGSSLFDESRSVYLDAGRLMASHIGIFGNTGSGKSNTLASLLKGYVGCLPKETDAVRILIFDLNNEYGGDAIVPRDKKTVYRLNTRKQLGSNRDRVPLSFDSLDEDSWGTILRATPRTQMPAVRRAYSKWRSEPDANYISEIKWSIADKRETLFFTLRNYCPELIKGIDNLAFNRTNGSFYYENRQGRQYIDSISDVRDIVIKPGIDRFQMFYLWLALEVSRAAESGINFEFVQPLLPRAKSVIRDLEKIFSDAPCAGLQAIFDNKPLAVVQLGDVNEASREMLPALIAELVMRRASENKGDGTPREVVTLVVDEAHNLLGYDVTQSDSVHGNTLRIFEKVIKEGRKFGVFLCLASQRPSDISPTITSQIHNYFIHKLVNPNDIERIRKTVSFMGETSLSMLSVLGQGECIVSGPSLHMPQYVYIDQLDSCSRPNSNDIQLFGDNGLLEQTASEEWEF